MIIIVLSVTPPSVKGDITKWLFEIHPGVYIGNPTRLVADRLWKRIERTIKSGKAVMVRSAHNEQGFIIQSHNSDWEIADFDGLQLMRRLPRERPKRESPSVSNQTKTSSTPCISEFRLPKEFVILDLETTGLDPEADSILEIGALRIRNWKIEDVFHTFVASEIDIPEKISALTGITADLLQGGATESEALYSLEQFINGSPIAGYNTEFDISFLKEESTHYELKFNFDDVIDVLELARMKINDVVNYKLTTVASRFGIKCETTHRALSDCKTILSVLEKLNKKK